MAKNMIQHFDVAVIGKQRAGIIAAAILAKRGRRVLLIPHEVEPHIPTHVSGFYWPMLPVILPNLKNAPHVQRVHDELGIGPEKDLFFKPIPFTYQIATHKHRLDLSGSYEHMQHELHIAFPRHKASIETFVGELLLLDEALSHMLTNLPPFPPYRWWQQLLYRKHLQAVSPWDMPCIEHPLFAELLRYPLLESTPFELFCFFSHIWGGIPSLAHMVRFLAAWCRGSLTIKKSAADLTTFLLEKSIQAGVTTHQGPKVRSIGVRGRNLGHITIEDDKREYSADFFINNTSGPISNLLTSNLLADKLIDQEEQEEPQGGLLVFNFIADDKVIPWGMAENLFLLNGQHLIRDGSFKDLPLFVQRFKADHHVVFCVAVPVYHKDIATDAAMQQLQQQIFMRLECIVPFLDNFLHSTDMHADAWHFYPLLQMNPSDALGLTQDNMLTCYKNLVQCNIGLMPGFGIEGDYITGLEVANRLQSIAGRGWRHYY